MRSASLGDEYPAKILLEAERRYGSTFVQLGIEKLSMFSGWHQLKHRKTYHYTLHGYNGAGWMTITLEMEASNNDGVFPYGQQHWNYWLVQAGVQGNLKAKYFFDARDHVEMQAGVPYHPDESPLGDNVVDYPWAYLTSVVAAVPCYLHHWFVTNRMATVAGDAPYGEGLKMKEGHDRGEA
ncbi:hypothetical protein EDD18DRAFT_1108488 [Armillaria luteobubalina]|uniref:Uncharacterized protein n=1 Tax=Armillaria luteobubalina TaxID=153913 RepID=A0AA39Q149_9AGAR|nr:hypothetical protein EDD18DRAFT_1108488 [Armillaria luteobubalina]